MFQTRGGEAARDNDVQEEGHTSPRSNKPHKRGKSISEKIQALQGASHGQDEEKRDSPPNRSQTKPRRGKVHGIRGDKRFTSQIVAALGHQLEFGGGYPKHRPDLPFEAGERPETEPEHQEKHELEHLQVERPKGPKKRRPRRRKVQKYW
eukprot:TRINITY_DN3051_c0_g1_i1.p1 TRINITY_DN3051_c0_g1~~TRINITY_DN3051_c0_g1_i1.p1  ORF type:complete len:150 (+),score=20.20 TRINITY_DN3051_c0_g1_i1:43-492(+)